jgi:hypothetical protein
VCEEQIPAQASAGPLGYALYYLLLDASKLAFRIGRGVLLLQKLSFPGRSFSGRSHRTGKVDDTSDFVTILAQLARRS